LVAGDGHGVKGAVLHVIGDAVAVRVEAPRRIASVAAAVEVSVGLERGIAARQRGGIGHHGAVVQRVPDLVFVHVIVVDRAGPAAVAVADISQLVHDPAGEGIQMVHIGLAEIVGQHSVVVLVGDAVPVGVPVAVAGGAVAGAAAGRRLSGVVDVGTVVHLVG